MEKNKQNKKSETQTFTLPSTDLTAETSGNWPWRRPRCTLFHPLWVQLYDCPLPTPGLPSPPAPPFLEPSQSLPQLYPDQGLLHHYSQKCRPIKWEREKSVYMYFGNAKLIGKLFGGNNRISPCNYPKNKKTATKYRPLTWPVSLTQTVCMPPATTCTTFSGRDTRAGFFLWRTSSPWPNCPTSPWPRTRTWPPSLPWLLWETIT